MSFGGLISGGSGNSGGGGARVVADIAPHTPYMSSGAIAQPHFLTSPVPNSMRSSSALSLSIVCLSPLMSFSPDSWLKT